MVELPVENNVKSEPTENPPLRTFDELSLAEALGRLIRHPLQTWIALGETLRRLPEPPADELTAGETTEIEASFDQPARPQRRYRPSVVIEAGTAPAPRLDLSAINWRALAPLIGTGAALVVALIGALIMPTGRNTQSTGSLWIGGILMIAASAAAAMITARAISIPRLPPLDTPVQAERTGDRSLLSLRAALMAVAALWTIGAWLFTENNTFTPLGLLCWITSIGTWTAALLDQDSHPLQWFTWQRERVLDLFRKPISFRLSWTPLVLLAILVIGAWFRFGNLSDYPPDMTSDHVEKALDAFKVYEGDRSIFFPNNGGRESFQMYYLAWLKTATGLPVNFEWLKIGSGLEGMLSLILLWWMGRAIIGEENRPLGNLVGLIMAGLAATSYWHVLISRLGLRIILTPLITTIIFVYLVRALRHNRRIDYLITGLALGASMYFYQSDRLLPLVVIAGVVIALIIRARTRVDSRRYLVNLVALVAVALVVFVPLGHYMIQYPESFWQRGVARIFGDDTVKDPNTGEVVRLNLTLADRMTAFQKNLPFLEDNFFGSLLMFNYKGHASFFDGSPEGFPALDFFSSALFALGLGIVALRIIRRRDPLDWLLPIALILTVLPGAIAIAHTVEVPSFTRSSGSLPIVYLITALPLAMLLREISMRVSRRQYRYVLYGGVVVLLVLGAASNADVYFANAMRDYRDAVLPHRQVGRLMLGFINSTGAPGNAFVADSDYWLDYRAVGIEADDPHWTNIVWRRPSYREALTNLILRNMNTRYEIRPDREMLFFLEPTHQVMLDLLKELFPKGSAIKIAAFKSSRDFLIYVVPPVGCDWIAQNVNAIPASCENVKTQEMDLIPTPPQ